MAHCEEVQKKTIDLPNNSKDMKGEQTMYREEDGLVLALKGYIQYYKDHLDYPISQLYQDWYGKDWVDYFMKGSLTKYLDGTVKEYNV